MLLKILIFQMMFSWSCYATSMGREIIKAVMSYDTLKLYKRNLAKKMKRLDPVFAVVGYYNMMTQETLKMNQIFNKEINSRLLVKIEYNKSTSDMTIGLEKIILL